MTSETVLLILAAIGVVLVVASSLNGVWEKISLPPTDERPGTEPPPIENEFSRARRAWVDLAGFLAARGTDEPGKYTLTLAAALIREAEERASKPIEFPSGETP